MISKPNKVNRDGLLIFFPPEMPSEEIEHKVIIQSLDDFERNGLWRLDFEERRITFQALLDKNVAAYYSKHSH